MRRPDVTDDRPGADTTIDESAAKVGKSTPARGTVVPESGYAEGKVPRFGTESPVPRMPAARKAPEASGGGSPAPARADATHPDREDSMAEQDGGDRDPAGTKRAAKRSAGTGSSDASSAASAKQTTAKRVPTKTTAKKTAAKKTTAKQEPATKQAATRSAAKKSSAKQTAAKSAATTSTTKKTAATTAAKKTAAKKTAAKKTAAKAAPVEPPQPTPRARRSYPLTSGRLPIVDVSPVVSAGRRPARAVPGETFTVGATVFREGHDALGVNAVIYDPEGNRGPWAPMRLVAPGTDRYEGEVTPTFEGDWTFAVEAWSDVFGTWRHTAEVKVPAGIDVSLVLDEGALLLERAAGERRADAKEAEQAEIDAAESDAQRLERAAANLRDAELPAIERLAAALRPEVTSVFAAHPVRELVTSSERFPVRVDRQRALYGSWYEFFPRSEGAVVDPTGLRPPRSGTFRTAARRLPGVAAMGFDVVYLPPIHPIGTTYRKGPNNSLFSGPNDVGSPWAIGGPLADGTMGGHDTIHPDLGTIEDFDAFVAEARGLGLEIALDFALQCSPDHPWVRDHPEWFHHRVDGTIAYAENPPKKYQDIYPLNFDTDFEGLYAECLRVLRYWMSHGVRIFRVDNPHTKPVVFWERLIEEIGMTDPDVLFLAEAFTRPAMLQGLARIGFHQSYSYFTWRTSKDELTEYGNELAHGPASAYLRPNLFVNTPDILHGYLVHGGREAFCVRAVLAATLGPSWGVYAGFELCENTPREPGSEEYLDSEKYQLRPRDWEGAEKTGRSIAPLLTMLNRFRREHPALHQLRNLRFHTCHDDAVLCYSKRSASSHEQGGDAADLVLVVVNLDPFNTRETTVSLDMPALFPDDADPWSRTFEVYDALTDTTYTWGRENYVRLDPHWTVAHVFAVRRSA
jgi:starch synthase (maltosyl-transferring)